MGDHLMRCGNQTDQCPNCRRYIRRAIFAYHFENNCACPDEADDGSAIIAERLEVRTRANTVSVTHTYNGPSDATVKHKARVHFATGSLFSTACISQSSLFKTIWTTARSTV